MKSITKIFSVAVSLTLVATNGAFAQPPKLKLPWRDGGAPSCRAAQ